MKMEPAMNILLKNFFDDIFKPAFGRKAFIND